MTAGRVATASQLGEVVPRLTLPPSGSRIATGPRGVRCTAAHGVRSRGDAGDAGTLPPEPRSWLPPAPWDGGGAAVDIGTCVAEALGGRSNGPDDPELIAVRPAHTVAELSVDGVGLSIHGERALRTPLAASSEVAATAERPQSPPAAGRCLGSTSPFWSPGTPLR